MITLLFLIAGLPEQVGATGWAHPDVINMRSGGDGAARFVQIGLYAFLLHAAALLMLLVLVVLGITERRRSTSLYIWLSVIGVLMLGNWWLIYSSYLAYLVDGEVNYFLGFPVSSAWMIYGSWISGGSLVPLYVFGFDKFVFGKEEEAEYLALINEFKSCNNTAKDDELL